MGEDPHGSSRQDYMEREMREAGSMNGFLKAVEGGSYESRIEMYLTLRRNPGKNPQK